MESLYAKKRLVRSIFLALIIGMMDVSTVLGASKKGASEEFACPLISSLKTIPALEEPVLLLFYASWCPMCHQMVDAFNEFLALNPKLTAFRIDVGGSGSAVGQKFGVSGVPTLLAVDTSAGVGAKEIQRFVGKLSLADLQRRVSPVVCPVA
jgi:thiol-disulfide isomerase/thioredoxin